MDDLRMALRALRQDRTRLRRRKGTVAAVNSDGTVNVDLGGTTTATVAVEYLADYAPLAGDVVSVLADDQGGMLVIGPHTGAVPRVQTAWKPENESVTSSTTFQNDNDLAFEIVAGHVYAFELWLIYSAGTTEDIKFRVQADSGTHTARHSVWALTNAASTSIGDTDMVVVEDGTAANRSGIGTTNVQARITGVWEASETTTVRLQWAQLTSGATATTLWRGSWMRAERLD